MNFRGSAKPDRMVILDFTAMVDLVFLLIIFFLTTSTFIEKNKSRLDLPDDETFEPSAATRSKQNTVIINLTANGLIIVSQEPLSLDALLDRIRAELAGVGGDASQLDVLIRADQRTPLKFLNEVASRLVELGVARWKLGAEAVGQQGNDDRSPAAEDAP